MALVSVVHTSFLSVTPLDRLFRELGPEIDLRHVVDDSLLDEVLGKGEVTPNVASRLAALYAAEEQRGSALILNACSSVGEVVDASTQHVGVPIVRIDSAMADEAVGLGPRIAVVATVETTLGPTRRLLEARAEARGCTVEILEVCVSAAFEALQRGDRAEHDRLLATEIERLRAHAEVVVCAQSSMASAVSSLAEGLVPVLTSSRSGVARAVECVRGERAPVVG